MKRNPLNQLTKTGKRVFILFRISFSLCKFMFWIHRKIERKFASIECWDWITYSNLINEQRYADQFRGTMQTSSPLTLARIIRLMEQDANTKLTMEGYYPEYFGTQIKITEEK